ncbi:MAG: helix-turn-helix domain-containing protein [Alphaproteobacteria bacterium]|nr:helix-turn-helix domain-containing protein [Alphaproteobacteria bacterium]
MSEVSQSSLPPKGFLLKRLLVAEAYKTNTPKNQGKSNQNPSPTPRSYAILPPHSQKTDVGLKHLFQAANCNTGRYQRVAKLTYGWGGSEYKTVKAEISCTVAYNGNELPSHLTKWLIVFKSKTNGVKATMNYILDLPVHWNQKLARKVRRYRKRRGFSQQELADSMHITEERLYRIETFSQPITVTELTGFMTIFDVTYREFFL